MSELQDSELEDGLPNKLNGAQVEYILACMFRANIRRRHDHYYGRAETDASAQGTVAHMAQLQTELHKRNKRG